MTAMSTSPIQNMEDGEFLDWMEFLASKRQHPAEGITLTAYNVDRLVALARGYLAAYAELEALKTGKNVILPQNLEHAQAMHLVATASMKKDTP